MRKRGIMRCLQDGVTLPVGHVGMADRVCVVVWVVMCAGVGAGTGGSIMPVALILFLLDFFLDFSFVCS